MAFNSPGEPFSVPDPLADDWDDMVRRNRLLQAQNDPLSFGEADDAGPPDPVADALNDASLSYADWLALRAQQLAGDTTTPNGGAQLFASTPAGVAAAAGARGPLTGRPGTAAMVAGALNTIAGGANTSAPIDIKGRVDGTISRGSGQDVRAQGKVRLPLLGPIPVDAGESRGVGVEHKRQGRRFAQGALLQYALRGTRRRSVRRLEVRGRHDPEAGNLRRAVIGA
jgi:hypothetical protein